MAPPPVTPSPHRFVIKNERAPAPCENPPRPGTQQFNATPRFTSSSAPRPVTSQTLPRATIFPSRYLTPGSRTAVKREVDTIEVSSDDFVDDAHNSIETDHLELSSRYTYADLEDESPEQRTLKRRRVSTSPTDKPNEPVASYTGYEEHDARDDPSSSLPILSSPPVSRHLHSVKAPRFLLSKPVPPPAPHPTSATLNTNVFLKPSRFRPQDPSTEAEAQCDPLPEQFSPHRKGQKYVSGGLAAEMRNWLVNIEGVVTAQGHQGKRQEASWLIKVLVDEVSGNERVGMTLIRGRQLHSLDGGAEMTDTVGIVKLVLAGEGAGTGLQKGKKVVVGKEVGIRGPMWEMMIEGERWGIGIDWKVF